MRIPSNGPAALAVWLCSRMTETVDEPAATGTNPLLVELTDEQVVLLSTIAWPLRSNQATNVRGWPVWDGVRRRFAHERPGVDAAHVLSSLPRLAPTRYWPDYGYGLWWRWDPKRSAGQVPLADDMVGLTIAGLFTLARHLDEPAMAADRIVRLISAAAAKESAVSPDRMWEVVDERDDLRQLLRTHGEGQIPLKGQTPTGQPVEWTLSVTAVARTLCREFQPFATYIPVEPFELNLFEMFYGGGALVPFAGVRDAEDYVSRVAGLARQEWPPTAHRSPLPLPETLDFLGYVLLADPSWTGAGGKLLTAGQSLVSPVANLRSTVTTEADFLARIADLWTVLGALAVPNAAPEEFARRDWTPGKQSLNNLQIWLENRFGDLYGDLVSADVQAIRDAQTIRTYGAHPNPRTAKRLREALDRFGLPLPILDWPGAWQVVQDRVAGAFDSIRVQLVALGAALTDA